MTEDVVARLRHCLVEELRKRGHSAGRPIKVSQLYQEIVPYRAVRSRLQVELNADYEHALLRLLAGEGGALRLEPEEARVELQHEAAEPYPYVGLYRKFSASEVWVNMEAANGEAPEATVPAVPELAPVPPPPVPPRPGPDPIPEGANPEAAPAPGPGDGEYPVAHDPGAAVQLHLPPPLPPPAEALPQGRVACIFCEAELPMGRRVRFCPFCGADQRLRPCPRCDAVLERGWHYCISCGHAQT
jgi:hypothetical protein